jgi:hypothetical protein
VVSPIADGIASCPLCSAAPRHRTRHRVLGAPETRIDGCQPYKVARI